jgi:polysaccharide pyruvyl transferase WcaK-like protein
MNKRKIRIFVTGIHETFDNGEVGQLIGLVEGLNQRFPQVVYLLGELNGERDYSNIVRILGENSNKIQRLKMITSPRIPWVLRVFFLLIRQFYAFPGCDLIVHLGMDGYSDQTLPSRLLSTLGVVGHSYQMLCGRLFGKPIIACSMSIGPFNYRLSRIIAKFTLNRITAITLREEYSIRYLANMKITSPVIKVADLAFLCPPSSATQVTSLLYNAGISLKRPVVGIAPSQLISSHIAAKTTSKIKYDMYISTMVEIINQLDVKGFSVVLLCQTASQKHDDRIAAMNIRERATYKPFIFDNNHYTPQEMKGIMQHCEMMISCKMHSAIFAASAGTPTVTIAYASKIYGIIGDMLHLGEYIVDIRNDDYKGFVDTLSLKIDKCLKENQGIRKILQQSNEQVCDLARANIECIAQYIKKNQSRDIQY